MSTGTVNPNQSVERYDYKNQAWTVNWRYMSCNHPDSMNCKCYGKLHAGELASEFKARTLAEAQVILTRQCPLHTSNGPADCEWCTRLHQMRHDEHLKRVAEQDPFQHATPCWIQGYGNMHTAQCIELNDCSAREICTCTRKPLMRTPAGREAYVLVQMLARGEVSL